MLNDLSPQFRAFWEKSCNEIRQTPQIRYIDEIRGPEYWDFDGLCERREKDATLVIALNRKLNPVEAELTILHEITHAILSESGFWEVRSRLNLEMIAPIVSCYSSVLTDPLIDQILREEGFRVERLLQRDLHKIRIWFNDSAWEPLEKDDPVFEMEVLRLIRLFLSGEIIECKDIKRLYKNNAPAIWETALSYLKMIQCVGFNSPEKQFRSLTELIERSTLRKLLVIYSPKLNNTL